MVTLEFFRQFFLNREHMKNLQNSKDIKKVENKKQVSLSVSPNCPLSPSGVSINFSSVLADLSELVYPFALSTNDKIMIISCQFPGTWL